ncbi:MAG: hypothetical protein ACOH1L_10875 [Thermomonas sp.]
MRPQKFFTALAFVALFASSGVRAAEAPVSSSESVLTLRLNGQLTIDPEGRVKSYEIRSELPPGIQGIVERAVTKWTFAPILMGGKPVTAQSPMSITLAATEADGRYLVRVDNVVFRPNTKEDYEQALDAQKQAAALGVVIETAGEPARVTQPPVISAKRMRPPAYPPEMLIGRVEGIVLMVLRLNPDGTVAEAIATQSSLLNVKGRPEVLDRVRQKLERSALSAARRWTFNVGAADPALLTPEDLTVRTPVEYLIRSPGSKDSTLAGIWRQEFRGPNLPVPWLSEQANRRIGVSDLATGEFFAGASRFRLVDEDVIGSTL